MPIIFYPYADDLEGGSLAEKLTVLMEAAERFKAVMLETAPKPLEEGEKKRAVPRDIIAAYNWDGIAGVLQEIRSMPEASLENKTAKAAQLTKLAEIYEVLRGAKMAKLEAVRLALMNEANQLNPGPAQVA